MVSNELLLLSLGHGGEGVVLALKVTIEGLEGLNDLGLDLKAAGLGDGGTEGEFSEVTGNTDTGGVDHGILVLGEVGAVKLVDIHGGNVLISWLVAVVGLDDLVHEGGEIVVRFVGTSVNTNTGVSPLGTGED